MPIATSMAGLFTTIADNYPKGTEPASLLDDAARSIAGITKTAHSYKQAAFSAGVVTLSQDGGMFELNATQAITSIVGGYALGQYVIIFTNSSQQALEASATINISATAYVIAGMAALAYKAANGVFHIQAVLPSAQALAAYQTSVAQGLVDQTAATNAVSGRVTLLEAWRAALGAQATTYGGSFNTAGYGGNPVAADGVYPGVSQTVPPGVWEINLQFPAAYVATNSDSYGMTRYQWMLNSGTASILSGGASMVSAAGTNHGTHYYMHQLRTLVINNTASNAEFVIRLGTGENRNGVNWTGLFGNTWAENSLYATLIR